MQEAVAVTTMCTWASSPRPASLPETVSVFPSMLFVIVFAMKCGLPAVVIATVNASMAITAPAIATLRVMGTISFYRQSRFLSKLRGRYLVGSRAVTNSIGQRVHFDLPPSTALGALACQAHAWGATQG